ncbi:peptidoglycan DD-metalloendopeptidase family protein [Jannaschia sp. R86511]|uniref:M23 family metallopeptidase n=1 Tax=Jannaschia sp. R86511 TaxID=3093853 RepID=UPI0036D214B7
MRALLPRCALFAATALTATFMAPIAAQASEATEAEVEKAKDEVAELAEEVDAASAEYEAVEARLESSQARVEAAEARVVSQAAVIARLEAELAGLAVETFKRGGVDPRLSALSGRSDYSEGTETLTLVAEQQAASLTDLEEAQVLLERAEQTSASELAEVEELEAELAERRSDIEARLEGAKDALAVVEAEHQARLEAEETRRLEQASRSGNLEAAMPETVMGSGQMAVPTSGSISSPFGYRIHPVYGTSKLHKGTDFATGCGTPVVAAQDGVVESAKWNGSYGNIVVVQHGGSLSTAYAHLQSAAVSSGPVSQGDVIGYVGTTGVSTGCHLHFEVRESGTPVDPMGYL